METMNKKSFTFFICLLFCISTLFPTLFIPNAHAQALEQPGAWTNPNVQYIDNWLYVTPFLWEDSDGSKEEITSGSTLNMGNKPNVQFSTSLLRKIGETYLGSYQVSDGRYLVLNEYALEVDIMAFTNEQYSAYFGYLKNTTFSEDLYFSEVWRAVETGTSRDSSSDPLYIPDPAFHSLVNPQIVLEGYDLDEALYNTIGSLQTSGNLRCSIEINTALWYPVFRNFRCPDQGDFNYTHELYTRILDVTSVDSTGGYLKDLDSTLPDYYAISGIPAVQDANTNGDGTLTKYKLDSSLLTTTRSLSPYSTDPDIQAVFTQGIKLKVLSPLTFITTGNYRTDISRIEGTIQNTGMFQGVQADVIKTVYYPHSQIPIRYTNSYGQDPGVGSIAEVEFLTPFTLRPETQATKYLHAWNYEKEVIGSYKTTISFKVSSVTFSQPGWSWKSLTPKISTPQYTTVISNWSFQNVYALSTYRFSVQIGAFYDWIPQPSPYFHNPQGQLQPPANVTDKYEGQVFPKVIACPPDQCPRKPEKPTALDWIVDNKWIVIASVSIIGGALILLLYFKKYRKPSFTKPIMVERQPTISAEPKKLGIDARKRKKRI